MNALRLASFNALSARSLRDGRVRPGVLAEALAGLDVDVLALQEVDRHQPRSGQSDQAAEVACALGAAHRFVPTVLGTPGLPGWLPGIRPGTTTDGVPAGGRDEGGCGAEVGGAEGSAGGSAASGSGEEGPAYGIALVSRRPVLRWAVVGLSGARGRYPLLVPGPRGSRVDWLRDEPRAAVAAVLADPLLTVACAHLSFVPGWNVHQLRRVIGWLATFPGPRLLLGDLNLPGRLPARLTGWTPLVTAATYPAPAPRLQLDHLLADGLPAGTRVSGAAAVTLPVSDHRAIVAGLYLP